MELLVVGLLLRVLKYIDTSTLSYHLFSHWEKNFNAKFIRKQFGDKTNVLLLSWLPIY